MKNVFSTLTNKRHDAVQHYRRLYRDTLFQGVLPFWTTHSPDPDFGGYFSCLDARGKVYDTDKFMWLQCREVWTFSMLYNQVEQRQEWRDMAALGITFLLQHGRDPHGHWYFSLNRQGQPLVQPYNIFSDCFAAMALGQWYKISGDEAHKHIARQTFDHILARQNNPKGKYNKQYPGTRPLEGFALPMILSNLVLEMEPLLEPERVDHIINAGIEAVMNQFYLQDKGLLLEYIHPDGSFCDSFEGRLVNPGHGLEAMWFMMDLGVKKKKPELIEKAVKISLSLLDFGWDRRHEGLFYFKDVKGHPPVQLEWDQKLWWVHLEAIIAMLKGYWLTGNEACWQWFEKLHHYSWTHFADTQYGEWYGYLNRSGDVLTPSKGGKWKGCFHVPRAFYQAWKTLENIQNSNLPDER